MKSLQAILHQILNYIFPPLCAGCEKEGNFLCNDCKKDIQAHDEMCPLCHIKSPHYQLCYWCKNDHKILQWVMIAFEYSSVIKTLILSLKYKHQFHIAAYLWKKIALLISSNPLFQQKVQKKNIIISSVPSHRIRKHFVKWYNQSELLAKTVAKELNLPYIPLTQRIRHTTSQTKLKREQRFENLRQAFRLVDDHNNDILTQKSTIIIIDDITTTGSSLINTALPIQQLYPNIEIRWAVVARNTK